MPLIQHLHILLAALLFRFSCGWLLLLGDYLDNGRIWWSRFIRAILFNVSAAASAHSFPTLSFYTCFIHKNSIQRTEWKSTVLWKKNWLLDGQRTESKKMKFTKPFIPPASRMTNRIVIYDISFTLPLIFVFFCEPFGFAYTVFTVHWLFCIWLRFDMNFHTPPISQLHSLCSGLLFRYSCLLIPVRCIYHIVLCSFI